MHMFVRISFLLIDEEEIYELISYDMLICMTKINSLKYNFFEYFKGKLFDFLDCITHDEIIQNKYNDKIVIYSKNGLLDDNNINRDKINYLCNNNKNVLSFVNKTYVKNFECLFYLCLYNEKNRIHNISINLIRNIENNIFTIYKYIHICNINTKELLNSLSLYYLVIIFIYIKNNLYNKEKIHLLKSFIQFLIIKEIKERIFLFKNELYFLAFIKILNLSICNNLFDFKILLCEKYFDDFIRILEESKLSMQEQVKKKKKENKMVRINIF